MAPGCCRPTSIRRQLRPPQRRAGTASSTHTGLRARRGCVVLRRLVGADRAVGARRRREGVPRLRRGHRAGPALGHRARVATQGVRGAAGHAIGRRDHNSVQGRPALRHRAAQLIGRRPRRCLARVVEGGATPVQRECHPVERATFEPDRAAGTDELHPLPRRRQRAHVAPARRAVDAEAHLVSPPIRAMLPSAIVPLQHHFARRIRRIEIDVREQRVAHRHRAASRSRHRNNAGACPPSPPTDARARRRMAPGCCRPTSIRRQLRPPQRPAGTASSTHTVCALAAAA